VLLINLFLFPVPLFKKYCQNYEANTYRFIVYVYHLDIIYYYYFIIKGCDMVNFHVVKNLCFININTGRTKNPILNYWYVFNAYPL